MRRSVVFCQTVQTGLLILPAAYLVLTAQAKVMPSNKNVIGFLAFIGIINTFNAGAAGFINAEKSNWLPAYINTHLITSIIVFAAWAHYKLTDGDLFSEVFTFVISLFTLSVCSSAFLANIGNLFIIRRLKLTLPYNLDQRNLTLDGMNKVLIEALKLPNKEWLTGYAIIDAGTALIAIPLVCFLLKDLLRSNYNIPRQSTSIPLLGLGTALICISVSRTVVYISELMVLRNSIIHAVGYINYTLDEPAWLGLSIATGVVTVLSSRGSYLLRGVSLASCTMLIWPAMFFMWIDYRAMDMTWNRSMSPFSLSPVYSILLAFMEIGVLLATGLTLVQQFPSSTKIKLEDNVRRLFFAFSVILLVIAGATIFLDLYSAFEGVFYRLFHGSEQKLPFLATLLSVFCYFAPSSSLGGVALPVCLAVAILTLNSTFFQLISYLWLTYNSYYPDMICPALVHGKCSNGNEVVTAEGTRLHLIEALLNFSAVVLSTLICFFVHRIGRIRVLTESRELTSSEKSKARRSERIILLIGVAMEVIALFLFVLVFFSKMSNIVHPLVTIYGYLYHLALAISLVVFPLYQIISAEGIHKQPVALNTLLALSVVRFTSVFSQLDYRNTGDDLDREWKIHHFIDMLTLAGTFYTTLALIELRGLTKPTLGDSESVPLDFNNPLEEMSSNREEGYVQLRAELNI